MQSKKKWWEMVLRTVKKKDVDERKWYPLMKKSYVSVLISVVKLELAAQNILKMMDTG